MTTTATRPTVDWQERARAEHERAERLAEELAAVRAHLDGDDTMARWWLQAKANRQRAALDRLTVRNTSLRCALRRIESLGRGLTRDEWVAARAAEAHLRTTEEPPIA